MCPSSNFFVMNIIQKGGAGDDPQFCSGSVTLSKSRRCSDLLSAGGKVLKGGSDRVLVDNLRGFSGILHTCNSGIGSKKPVSYPDSFVDLDPDFKGAMSRDFLPFFYIMN